MKNITFLSLTMIFIILFGSSCKKENPNYISDKMTNESHFTMIKNVNQNIDQVLIETKPTKMSLQEYKLELLSGKIPLPKNQQHKILEIISPIVEYGRNLAIDYNIDQNDLSSVIALGSLTQSVSLGTNLSERTFNSNRNLAVIGETHEKINSALSSPNDAIAPPDNPIIEGALTWTEVGDCVISAIGFDVIWSVAPATGTSWTIAALRTTFTNIAKRFLGPVGVAIATVSFAYCLYQHTYEHVLFEDIVKPMPTDPAPAAFTDTSLYNGGPSYYNGAPIVLEP